MSKKSNDVVITTALRTPIGTYKGSLKGLSADKLGALAIKEAVYKSKLKSDDIDEVIMGHVLTSGLGQNPADKLLFMLEFQLQTCTYNQSSMWIWIKICNFRIPIY